MIGDDLPSNPEYLDTSFGAAGGLTVLEDDEDVLSGNDPIPTGVETIKMIHSPIEVVENYYETINPASLDFASQ